MPRTTLITGVAGFIGSWLAEMLCERGDSVIGIDDESTGLAENLTLLSKRPNFEYVRGSVSDLQTMRPLLEKAEHVYHLAAAVGVQLISDKLIDSIERNIAPLQMMLQVLAEMHESDSAKKIYIASSSEVYGKNPNGPWAEDADLVFGPTTRSRWSYGAAKALDEFLALAYFRERNLPVVIGRFFNVVGPRQRGSYGMVLPRFVDAALQSKPLLVHDDGKQVRCFAHVHDVCNMITRLMEKPSAVGEVFNIGSDVPVTILELAKQVARLVTPQATIEFQSYANAYSQDFEDVRVRVPNLQKIRSQLNYNLQYDLDRTIQEVFEWKKQSNPEGNLKNRAE